MNTYITANTIKELRIKKRLTQLELANMLSVSDKTISKWETGRGLPDISMLEPLAKTFDISISELLNGIVVKNNNTSANMLKCNFHVCPICGNIINTMGKCVISCCGITLPALESDISDLNHDIHKEIIDNKLYISINHPMAKTHYISFLAYVTYNKCEVIKLYPEQNAEAHFEQKGKGIIYAYCNQDGLFSLKL